MKTSFFVDKLEVAILQNPKEIGRVAAEFVAEKLNEAIFQKDSARLILATGTSQFTFLESLKEKGLNWQKITVFHLDEYKGLSDNHPASFRKYLKDRILNSVRPKKIHFLNGDAKDLEREIIAYSNELRKEAIDLACIGIGENGHLAFNDPPVADFDDSKFVKLVHLDAACRNQQLGEGWFSSLAEVPKEAITLTIPAIMHSKCISCVVPDLRKARAVHNALYEEINTSCPASILRTHRNAKLFLDHGSASLFEK